MKKKDLILALLVVTIWGANFTVIKLGLSGVPSMLLVTLRYIITAFPAVFFVKKPNAEWKYVIMYGLAVGVLQFACLFYAMEIGMPASLASIILQMQAFISPMFAMLFLKEKLKAKQIIGFSISALGLYVIGSASGTNGMTEIPKGALLLMLAAPVFWALSNIILRFMTDKSAVKGEKIDMMSLIVWSALIPPLPVLCIALMLDTPETLINAVLNMNGMSLFAVLYLAFGATLFGYGGWSILISKYPMSRVAPISLLVPVTGLLTARIVLHEQLSKMQWLGVFIILMSLAIANLDVKSFLNYFSHHKAKNTENR